MPYLTLTRPELMRRVRDAIRYPSAWPGLYPHYVLLSDGAYLCRQCARENYRALSDAAREPEYRTGWEPVGVDVLWEYEDPASPETCVNCYAVLPSAYDEDPTPHTGA